MDSVRNSLAVRIALFAAMLLISSVSQADQTPSPITNIPRISGVDVRDAVADWKGQGLVVHALAGDGAVLSKSTDFQVAARLGWDDEGVLVQVNVTDSTPWQELDDNRLYQGDSVELFLTSLDHPDSMEQIVASPAIPPRFPQARVKVFDYRTIAFKADAPAFTPRAVSKPTDHGYVMDMLLPWASMKIKPDLGTVVGVRFCVNNSDGKNLQKAQWLNYKPASEWMNLPAVKLSEDSSPANPIAVWAGYDEMKSIYINAIGDSSTATKPLEVWHDGKMLSQASLAVDGDRATAQIELPMPPVGQTIDKLDIHYDGQVLESLPLPDAVKMRKDLFMSGAGGGYNRTPAWLRPTCPSDVFSGNEFPAYAYPEPDRINQLVGGFTLETAYYDAQYQRVTKPSGPGRYGAVTTVMTTSGDSFVRYQTLFCAPKDSQSTESAARLAALAANPAATPFDAAKADRTWWHEMRKKLGTAVRYEYFVRLPKGYDDDPQKRWPVIFYLHGSGRGDDPQRARNDGIQIPAREKSDFPFVAVSLRSPGGWEPPAVEDVIDEVAATCRTDPSRYYMTGFSMGAGGTLAIAQDQPDKFAAIVMVGGGGGRGGANQIGLLKGTAAWVINGGDDSTAPAANAVPLIQAMQSAGVEVKSTVIPHAGHAESDDLAFRWDDLYSWLLQHHR